MFHNSWKRQKEDRNEKAGLYEGFDPFPDVNFPDPSGPGSDCVVTRSKECSFSSGTCGERSDALRASYDFCSLEIDYVALIVSFR